VQVNTARTKTAIHFKRTFSCISLAKIILFYQMNKINAKKKLVKFMNIFIKIITFANKL